MAIYNNEKVLYVRLFNNMYYFFVSENDRNGNINFIYQSIKLPTGVNITFDFNHVSHTNNRLTFTVEDTKHEQINANYVPGVSDYSKLIFDQGAFGQISGVQPVMAVGSNPYTGVLKVFSANVLGANISSSIAIEVESAMKSIGDPSNSLNLEIGDSRVEIAQPYKGLDAAFNKKLNQYDIYVGVADVSGADKFVLYTLNADYDSSSTKYFDKSESDVEKSAGFVFTEIDVSGDFDFINFNKSNYNFITAPSIISGHPLEIQSSSDSTGLFNLISATDREGSILPIETTFDGRSVSGLTNVKFKSKLWNTASIVDGTQLKIICTTHDTDMGSLYDGKLWFNKSNPDLELFVNKDDSGTVKIYQPSDGSSTILTHFASTTAPSTWTIVDETIGDEKLLKATTSGVESTIGTLVDNTSHARMLVEGSNVRFYYKGLDDLSNPLKLSRVSQDGSVTNVFVQESTVSDTWVVPVNNNAFAPRDYTGLREQALYVYTGLTAVVYYNTAGPDDVEIHGHGLVNLVVFHTISPGLPLCFHENTPIMTEHGKVPIKDLKRGTMVQTLNGLKPLARLMVNEYIIFGQEFVKFPAHCLGENVPTTDVLCTREHPLMFDFKTVAAKEFVGKVKGVEIVHSTSNQYNLLFEEQEYVNIEGITFVSHHPNHVKGLKIEEYFSPMKFRPGVFKEKLFKFEDLSLTV